MKNQQILATVSAALLGIGAANGAEIANSISEFSGVQGQDGWQYGYLLYLEGDPEDYEPGDWTEFAADGTTVHDNDTNHWTGSAWDLSIAGGTGPWTVIQSEAGHPNGTNSAPGEEHWAIRRWVADEIVEPTPLALTWHLRSNNTAGGGTGGQLHINGKQVDKAVIGGSDQTGVTRTYYANITEGDIVDLALTPENVDGTRGDGSDSSSYSLRVNNTLPPLPIQPDGSLFIPAGEEGDSDGDGLPDFWEKAWFPGDLAALSATGDADSDGATDEQEFEMLLDPTKADTDGDGASDGDELAAGSDPKDPDSSPNIIADSIAEFSETQGENNWFHGYRNLFDDDGEIDYEVGNFTAFPEDWWTGTAWDNPDGDVPWTYMAVEDVHPNGENNGEEIWVIRRWVADEDELSGDMPLAVTWHVREVNLAGTGVTGSLHVNGVRVDSAALAGGDATGVTRTVYINAEVNDAIDLALTPVGAGGDTGDGSDGSASWMRISTGIPSAPFQPDGSLFIPAGQTADSDGDGLIDFWELAYFPGDLNAASAAGDADNDGLTDKQEFDMGLPPNNPDTDADGFTDGSEITAGTDPKDANDSPGFIARSIDEFSGEQGLDNWRYGYRNFTQDGGGTDYNASAQFIEFGTDDVEWWNGNAWDWPDGNVPWTVLGVEDSHPNGNNNGDVHWTVRRWEVELEDPAPLAITWHVRKTNTNGGNGVTGAVHHNGARVDSLTVAGNDGVGGVRTVYVNAKKGDVIDLIHSPRGTDNSDADGSDGSALWMNVSTGIPPNPVQPDGTPFIPSNADDSDGDGLPDAWELLYAGNLGILAGDGDNDSDLLNNLGEFARDSDPTKPDTDGDGLNDNVETATGTFVSATDTGTNPKAADTDNDGRSDGEEVTGTPRTNPVLADTDGDGFSDGVELVDGTDPNDAEDNRFSGLIANSVTEFSGEQGQDNWFYGYRNLTLDEGEEDSYDPNEDFIQFGDDDTEWWNGQTWDFPDGNVPWTSIGPQDTHPNGDNNGELHWTVRRWVAEQSAKMSLRWSIRKTNANCGNGVTGGIFVNGQQLDSATIAFNDGVGVERVIEATISQGDFVDFIHSPLGEDGTNADGCDGSAMSLQIRPVGAVVQFQVESVRHANGAVTVTWKSSEGSTYAIDFTSDLQDWSELDDGIEGEPDSTSFQDTPPAGVPARYYRVRRE